MKKAKLKKQPEQKIKNKQEDFSIKSLVIAIVIICLILGGFYLLTERIVKNTKDETAPTKEVVNVRKLNDIDYSDIEKMVTKNYYLLFDEADDKENEQYDLYINSLKYNNFPLEFYYIDLSKDENKDILGDKESLKDLDEIKVKETTLVYVKDGKISKTYVGSKEIIKYLSSFFEVEDKDKDTDKKSNSNESKESNKEESNDKK